MYNCNSDLSCPFLALSWWALWCALYSLQFNAHLLSVWKWQSRLRKHYQPYRLWTFIWTECVSLEGAALRASLWSCGGVLYRQQHSCITAEEWEWRTEWPQWMQVNRRLVCTVSCSNVCSVSVSNHALSNPCYPSSVMKINPKAGEVIWWLWLDKFIFFKQLNWCLLIAWEDERG